MTWHAHGRIEVPVKPSRLELIQQDCLSALGTETEKLAPLRKSTLVITGGTGFVGTWLAEMVACLNDRTAFGMQTVLISRHTSEFKDRFPHLANRKDFNFLNMDVRDLGELPRETNWVIHAAANPDNRFHSSNPIETMSVIAKGTDTVLRALDRCANIKMFLNMSSASIYGSQPLELETLPENFSGAPQCSSSSSAYGEAKRYAETFCSAARTQAQLPVATVRPFAFVGPFHAVDTPWAINNFIRDALQGNAIRVFGDGQTIRSYMYGADMAFWLLRILTTGTSGQTFNLGSPNPITLEKLAQLISSKVSPNPEIRLNTAGTSALQRSRLVPDVSAAKNTLDLTLKFSLERAIERTILWNQSR